MKKIKSIALVMDDGSMNSVTRKVACDDPVEVLDSLIMPALELTRTFTHKELGTMFDPDFSSFAAEFRDE